MIHVFIVNSFAGHSERALELRKRLEKYDDLTYFVFNTLNAGDEEEIAKKMCRFFKGETIRFYCCGGSGTLRNMLDGISNLNNSEIAYYPCGTNNDYIKCFGEDARLFHNIDNLINGNVAAVDYIKTNHGLALNTVSIGMDANVVAAKKEYMDLEGFGRRIPYFLGLIRCMIKFKTRKLRVNIGKDSFTDEVAEILIGNGCVIAGNMHISRTTEIDDGYCEYGFATRKKRLGIIRIMISMIRKKFDKVHAQANVGKASYFEVRSIDEEPIDMNLDGEIIRGDDYWRIEVIHKGLNLVVPEGIDVRNLNF